MVDSVRPPRSPLVAPGDVDHHVTDMTVTVSADVPLARLQEILAGHKQWLPVDGDPSGAIGALVETNSTGPLRLGYGGWRDLLLGSQFMTRGGKLITAGGRTMKNVAGYDVTKLMVGQHGLLGTLQTLTLRTYRRPAAALLVEFAFEHALLSRLLPTSLRPQWAMLAEQRLWCGYLGDEPAIEFYEKSIRQHAPISAMRHALQADIDFRAARWLPERPGVPYRLSVPPVRVYELIQSLAAGAGDPAFGIIVGSCGAENRLDIRKIAQSNGGSVVFAHPEELSTFFAAAEPQLSLLRRLQSAFDQ